jgi:hypothetical protein
VPNRTIVEASCRLAKDVNAAIITNVFQNDTTLSPGACRAIISVWVGALITKDNTLATLREKLDTSSSGKLHEEYDKLQKLQLDYINNHLEIPQLRETLEVTVNAFDQLEADKPTLILQSRDGGAAVWDTQAALAAKIRSLSADLNGKAQKRWALIASNQKRDTSDLSTKDVALDTLFRSPASVFTMNGLYYLVLPGHAVGMFYHATDERLFLDANTGEWVLPASADVGSFLAEYFKTFYKNKYATIENLIGFRRDDTTKKLHRPPRPCPYGPCPYRGAFTLACEYKDR